MRTSGCLSQLLPCICPTPHSPLEQGRRFAHAFCQNIQTEDFSAGGCERRPNRPCRTTHSGRQRCDTDNNQRAIPTYRPGDLLPFECLETGRQLVQPSLLLLLHPIMEELTNSVQLLIAQVAVGTEVEGQRGEFHQDAATAAA